jgi:hypothetical protein
MNQPIQYRAIGGSTWSVGTLVDGLNGNLAIQVAGGYVTMDRNGSTRVSATMGDWEGSYRLGTDAPVLRITPNVVTYVLEIKEV